MIIDFFFLSNLLELGKVTYLSVQNILGQLSLVLGQCSAFSDAATSGRVVESEWHLKLPKRLLEMLLHGRLQG